MRVTYVYTRAEDGGVTIVSAVEKGIIERDLKRKITDEEYIERVKSFIPQNALNIEILDYNAVPLDREFRDAWVQKTGEPSKLDVDLIKAKEIQLLRIREKRNKLLQKYDALLIRAQEIGTEEEINELKTKKQELRDATEPLKNAVPKSVEEIKLASPDLSGY